MKVLLRPSMIVLGTTTALLGGGGMLAYAGWSTETDSVAFTVDAARIPRPPRPTVTLPEVKTPSVTTPVPDATLVAATPRIGWQDVELAGETVHRYVVTRHDGQVTDVVCTVPATRARSCLDLTAPPATELTYTVAAAYGSFWVGLDSPPSRPITTPATPLATPSSVPTESEPSPSVTPSAAVSPTAGVASRMPEAPPTSPPATDVASAEPPVAVAPPTSSEPTVEPFEVVEPSSEPSVSPSVSLSPSGS